MSTALLVMTDGRREMFERTMASFFDTCNGVELPLLFIHNDSGDWGEDQWLKDWVRANDIYGNMADNVVVYTTRERSGFGGAIRNAWRILHELHQDIPFEWVFHLEDDFLFNEQWSMRDLQDVMSAHPYIAQMAFKRQPWGSDAEFANGFMEKDPGSFTEQHDLGHTWVITRKNWTTNPSLFHADLLAAGWPEDPFSEGKYGFVLKENGLWIGNQHVHGDQVQFGIWGAISDPPRVHHIGDYRVGTGY